MRKCLEATVTMRSTTRLAKREYPSIFARLMVTAERTHFPGRFMQILSGFILHARNPFDTKQGMAKPQNTGECP